MLILRIVLFLGLVGHKLVWELLKRPGSVTEPQKATPISLGKRLIKLVKVMALAFLLIQTLFLSIFPISKEPLRLRVVGLAFFFIGLAIAIEGRLRLGDNWANLEDYQAAEKQMLVKTGIYRLIRHPIYVGDLLLLIGHQLALNSWLVLGAILPLLVVAKQTIAEENLLAQRFPEYDEYRKQTKQFIPFIY